VQQVEESMFEKVACFNYLPAAYINDSWIESPKLSGLYRQVQVHLSLYQRSDMLFTMLGLDRHVFSDFDGGFTYRRIAFLDKPVFDHLAFKLGLIYLSPILKRTIDGTLARALKQALEEDEIFFIQKTADFFAADFFYTLFNEVVFKLDQTEKIRLQLTRVGHIILYVLFKNEPNLFFSRFCLRLDAKLVTWMLGKEKVLTDTEKKQLVKLMIKLLNNIEPSCKALFA
jgi:YOP proteins translocation protein K (YscK)